MALAVEQRLGAVVSRTNGFVERVHRTLLDECLRGAGYTTWYLEPEVRVPGMG
jgi:hypothetical protein